jgi:tRNA (cytidine/uridine-2'-O-)-methyltransferase
MINVVLYQPENPHNTGAIVRTCALLNAQLHLVRPYGFAGLDGDVKRSSMSYLESGVVSEHDSWEAFLATKTGGVLYSFWDAGERLHTSVLYGDDDYLIFGRESNGLPVAITSSTQTVRIEMNGIRKARSDHRDHSLNLSVSAGIAIAEANRVIALQKKIIR